MFLRLPSGSMTTGILNSVKKYFVMGNLQLLAINSLSIRSITHETCKFVAHDTLMKQLWSTETGFCIINHIKINSKTYEVTWYRSVTSLMSTL